MGFYKFICINCGKLYIAFETDSINLIVTYTKYDIQICHSCVLTLPQTELEALQLGIDKGVEK